MKTDHGRRISRGYGRLLDNQRLPAFQKFIPDINKALEKMKFEWED
jgi:hypothetical protein